MPETLRACGFGVQGLGLVPPYSRPPNKNDEKTPTRNLQYSYLVGLVCTTFSADRATLVQSQLLETKGPLV